MLCVGVNGERALFARPEFRGDHVSYDFITPHAAAAMLRGIHDPGPLHWVIDSIRIVSPFRCERLVERGHRLIVLRDVGYVIAARLEGDETHDPADSLAIVTRSLRRPVAVHLGRPRFPGQARLLEAEMAVSPGAVLPEAAQIDHGWMLHSIAFAGDRRPRFFRAQSVGGVVRVPPVDSPLLFA